MHVLMVILLILIGVLLFGFVIFFHELGHFLLAKASKIRVNEFALGMGPRIFGFKKGETQYTLRLLPIGGFCSMEGEDEESGDERAFGNKPVWRRILVVIAGGIFNIFLGFVMMLFLQSGQELFATNQISSFLPGSALQAAGVQEGDYLTKINGYRIYTDRDVGFALSMADPDAVQLVVKRDGKSIDLGKVKLSYETREDGTRVIQYDFRVVGVKPTAWRLITRSAADTFSMARMVIESLKGILTGRFGLNDMAGPVGTAQVITQAAGEGLKQSFSAAVSNIVMMMIMITVNLGIVNLLPLPALDGGRLLFLIWEGITRKPVPQKYEGYIHAAGFVLLIGLMVVITGNDILRLISGG